MNQFEITLPDGMTATTEIVDNKLVVTFIKQEEEKPFPKLMQDSQDGQIIFFVTERKGVTLNDGKRHQKGHYSENWAISAFDSDYNGKVEVDSELLTKIYEMGKGESNG